MAIFPVHISKDISGVQSLKNVHPSLVVTSDGCVDIMGAYVSNMDGIPTKYSYSFMLDHVMV